VVLADCGADVINVEPPGGDPARPLPSAPMWLRGKRSVIPDLAGPSGQEVLHRLVLCGGDVVVASYGPGAARARRADYETLAALNPALVYCISNGLGATRSLRELPRRRGVGCRQIRSDVGVRE
jgi:crotonobetainyl-CoA:carnitine CoA-transferase CaiB-like acyl-CoA transferase